MTSLRSRLVMAMAAGSLAVVPTVNTRLTQTIGPRGPSDPQAMYQKGSKEFYMTADELGYIRPGFHITVNSITIPADRAPGRRSHVHGRHRPAARPPRARSRPAPSAISQVLAWWDAERRATTPPTRRASRRSPITGVAATQAAADSGGTWTDLDDRPLDLHVQDGRCRPGYDETKTHTLAIYATRNMTDISDKNYYDNVEHDFRPDGADGDRDLGQDRRTRPATRCHNPLSAHGGSRQDVKLCVTCHQPQTVDPDTGNTVDFKVMIHKIHRGENLPSVEAGTPVRHHRQPAVGPRLLDGRLPAGHPQLRDLPHAAPATQSQRLVHVPAAAPPAAPATTTSTG